MKDRLERKNMARQVKCISKDNGYHEDPHVAITRLGWIDDVTLALGRSTRMEMVNFVEQGGVAYVKDIYGIARLVVRISSHGNKYVKTVSDGRETDNLLKLPEC